MPTFQILGPVFQYRLVYWTLNLEEKIDMDMFLFIVYYPRRLVLMLSSQTKENKTFALK